MNSAQWTIVVIAILMIALIALFWGRRTRRP